MTVDKETAERWKQEDTRQQDEVRRMDSVLIDLGLPPGQWVLVGSGVMLLHEIERKRPLGDLDIFCSTCLWFDKLQGEDNWKVFTTSPHDPARRTDPPYLYKVIDGLEVNLFYAWRFRDYGNINTNSSIEFAEEVAGWPCMSLGRLLAWKQACNREKDQHDIAAIKEHLAKEPVPRA